MDPEEYEKMMEEMRSLMADPVKIDPEEEKAKEAQKKAENAAKFDAHVGYAKKQSELEKERLKKIEEVYKREYGKKEDL